MEQFNRVCLAFCFMQFHVGRFEIPPNHVRLVYIGNSSESICCLPPSFALVYSNFSFGRYIFLFWQAYTYLISIHVLLYFFGEIKKKLYAY